ncbi:hypothetical protein JWG42_14340 [Desulfoprunum benzoelyticum]|uniref:Uncharacterized protein n=1 Tax=Desulfoprunum benzoelyticum TaxID=1506996 RepID=A0A840V6N7_9BACT|nr:hypothetical protein [Desulfoprunum benzoelyticum]MBB5349580.1 hypothetical protein [Desulfoprunum benzoelyticum]MBM9531336.1 hypothetical protein [Desulfoprunum benzoelyticum]
MSEQPDWDKYFNKLKFQEYKERSPFLSSRSYPTVYNEDRTWLYLGSLEVGVEIKNLAILKHFLDQIEKNYKSWSLNDERFYRQSLLKSDMELLKDIIADR